MVIVLDTFPASSAAKRPGRKPSVLDQCREWLAQCESAGHTVLVPAIAYYEVLRELELREASGQIARLKEYCLQPDRFIPLVTEHLEAAARLWVQSRRAGQPLASPEALDGDVLLAAQVLSLGIPAPDLVVATTNTGHLARFVPVDLWTNIAP